MRLTIVPDDNIVVIDGIAMTVDCSTDPSVAELHAVQWFEDRGHIEYDNPAGTEDFRHNEAIDSIEPYQGLIDGWSVAKAEADALKAAQEKSLMEFKARMRMELK